MREGWWMLGALALGVLAGGCGGSSPPSPVVNKLALAEQQQGLGAGAAQKPAVPAVMPRSPEPGPPLPPLSYEGKGRRDPFSPITLAVEKSVGLEVSAVKLVGIIRGGQLLALVEAPDGLGYILKPGDVLGNGRVTDITPSSVSFAVAGRAGQRETSLTLRLAKE